MQVFIRRMPRLPFRGVTVNPGVGPLLSRGPWSVAGAPRRQTSVVHGAQRGEWDARGLCDLGPYLLQVCF